MVLYGLNPIAYAMKPSRTQHDTQKASTPFYQCIIDAFKCLLSCFSSPCKTQTPPPSPIALKQIISLSPPPTPKEEHRVEETIVESDQFELQREKRAELEGQNIANVAYFKRLNPHLYFDYQGLSGFLMYDKGLLKAVYPTNGSWNKIPCSMVTDVNGRTALQWDFCGIRYTRACAYARLVEQICIATDF